MFKIIFSNPVRLLEFFAIAFVVVIALTQIAVPLITESALFPILSRKPKIKGQIADTNEALEEESLANDLTKRKQELDRIRSERSGDSAEENQSWKPNKPSIKNPKSK